MKHADTAIEYLNRAEGQMRASMAYAPPTAVPAIARLVTELCQVRAGVRQVAEQHEDSGE